MYGFHKVNLFSTNYNPSVKLIILRDTTKIAILFILTVMVKYYLNLARSQTLSVLILN